MAIMARVPLLVSLIASALIAIHPHLQFAAGAGNQKPLGGVAVDYRPSATQNNVTWDEYSFFINGERTFIFSGEIHPWRNPVQSLHLDILQKLKAAGFNTVSIYFHWGVVEYERGVFRWGGIFDVQPFLDAAKEAGLYVIARPGPYVNAETTGGGFPGWGTRVEGLWRKSNRNYTEAWKPFVKEFGEIIARNEISKGGPIILVQVENEYSGFGDGEEDFEYEEELLQAFKDSGITVPTICDDAWLGGHFQSTDIYGWNTYPLAFDCSHPDRWHNPPPSDFWESYNRQIVEHRPRSILELQAGAFDGWGGAGYDTCAQLIGSEFECVYYKSIYASGVKLVNLYMAYGGTNFGQLAEPGVYTSYDYGSIIREDRRLRAKYYELKLQTQFLKVSPAFLTSVPWTIDHDQESDIFGGTKGLTVTVLEDAVGEKTKFYVVRQTDFSKFKTIGYRIKLQTSLGTITVPKSGPPLDLQARDSNILVVDYHAGDAIILYSTVEIYTWKQIDGVSYVFVYGDEGEFHETAFKVDDNDMNSFKITEPEEWSYEYNSGMLIFRFPISDPGQTGVIKFGNTALVVSSRKTASATWVLDTEPPTIVRGGYLIRSSRIESSTLHLVGDLDQKTEFHILASSVIKKITLNGKNIDVQTDNQGWLYVVYKPQLPEVKLPTLSKLEWKRADSLPEVTASYDDSDWMVAKNTYTPNAEKPATDRILFASDYGFHSGNILWKGHFKAAGGESEFWVKIQGGRAFGYSVWDNDVYLGFWEGDVTTSLHEGSFKLPSTWKKGEKHIITILQDHMGLEENWTAATEEFKTPRGIFAYGFGGSKPTLEHWKVTGNLGGEKYIDTSRGPLNEGGLYAERQGWHLPGFDDSGWQTGSPLDGLDGPGVAFYRSTFDLDVSSGIDCPMSIELSNSTGLYYRSQIYVNGYQFGKYVNSIGPQTSFYIPQGILNYNGQNTLAISLWAMQTDGARLKSLDLQIRATIESSIGKIENAPMPTWQKRAGAY